MNHSEQRADIIVYHDVCHDGLTALWVCLQRWPDAEPYAATHSVPPDLARLAGRHVVMVDFTWKRAALLEVERVAASLLVLDHHESAAADLSGLTFAVFDMNRSGAGMAWDELLAPTHGPRPWLVDYVEDRDLWRFKLPKCREVHAACNSYPLTLEARRDLMHYDNFTTLAAEGVAILRYHDKLVDSAVGRASRIVIDGMNVPCLWCPSVELISDIGQRLAVGEPFAAVFMADKDGGGYTASLRSAPDGVNVAEVAARHGGGGHRHAAGYHMTPVMP